MNNMHNKSKQFSQTAGGKDFSCDAFLKLLGKITESVFHPDTDLEIACRNFDECLHFEGGIEEALSQAMFPDVSLVAQKLTALSDSLEQISLFPELNCKPIWLWSAKNTGILFRQMAPLFRTGTPDILKNYNTIPFLIINSDNFSMEVLNFANSRVEISLSDFSLLLSGKGTTKIALNQIIKMFILHIPLKECCGAFVFDTTYGDVRKRFGRFITECFCFLEKASELSEYWTAHFEHKICAEKINPASDKKYIFIEDFFKTFPLRTKIPIYGFFDEFLSVKNKVMIYYLNAVAEKRKHVKMLKNDIVMLENSSMLNNLWKKEAKAEEVLKEEEKKLSAIFVQASVYIERIRDILNDVMTEQRFVPHRISDLIFEAFFESQGLSRKYTDSIVARMRVLALPQIPMIEEFLLRTRRFHCHPNAESEKTAIPSKVKNWIEAKIVLSLFHLPRPEISLSTNTMTKLTALLKYAERHISTGKEYYVKYLIQNDQSDLWKSLELGYYPSGKVLYSLCEHDKEKLTLLAHFLVPDACYSLGKEEIEEYLKSTEADPNSDFSFDHDAFFYMKIAASMHYIPALAYFADLFYTCFFSKCEPIKDERHMNFAKMTMAICRFLLQQKEEINRENIQKILGVTAFCTQDPQNLKIARTMLLHLYCPEAKYCLGYMYEFGKGYVQNLHRAKHLMQEADDFAPAKERIRSITSKLNLEKARAAKAENYDKNDDYSTVTHTTCSSSSTCIVLAILGVACTSSTIRKMHTFAHRELLTSSIGKSIMREYYRTGSQIMSCIKHNPDASEEYEKLREKFISTTFQAVQHRNYHEAMKDMVELQAGLCRKYGISVQPELLAKLQKEFPDIDSLKQTALI